MDFGGEFRIDILNFPESVWGWYLADRYCSQIGSLSTSSRQTGTTEGLSKGPLEGIPRGEIGVGAWMGGDAVWCPVVTPTSE